MKPASAALASFVAALVSAAALTTAAAAHTDQPLAGCPLGGPGAGWVLINDSFSTFPYIWGPAAAQVDAQGNNDGCACKNVYTLGNGQLTAQVIDNRVPTT
jgi:hypothetical protein